MRSSIFYPPSSVLGSRFSGRCAVDLRARLAHQLREARAHDLLPLANLGLFQRAAAVFQLHRHIPALPLREPFELFLTLFGPALDEALKRAHEDVRAIR